MHAQGLDGDVVEVIRAADGGEDGQGGDSIVGEHAIPVNEEAGVEAQNLGVDDEPESEVESVGDEGNDDAVDESSDDNESSEEEDGSESESGSEASDDQSDEQSSIRTDSNMGSNSWEGEVPPLDINEEALMHIATQFLPGGHGRCIEITTIPRGSYHEIRLLHFEDGWICIGRFTREDEPLEKAESELATTVYVRSHTTIPVPEIYFVNHNRNHVVGSAFVLMERLEGKRLIDLWKGFSLAHKKVLIGKISNIVGQLTELKFDRIGSLQAEGRVGPLVNTTGDFGLLGDQSFTSTLDYMFSYLGEKNTERSAAARKFHPAIKDELRSFFVQNDTNPILHAPYRLIHGDFESQNFLVVQEDPTRPPKITGVIDWEWSHTGLLYYLCEYPKWIQDIDSQRNKFRANKVLRKHFVSSLAECFPKRSAEREHVKCCFREKSHTLNKFRNIFMKCTWADAEVETSLVQNYLRSLRGEYGKWDKPAPYGGVPFWQPDSESESESEED